MSWTYTGNPASSTRDAVRYLAGQTSSGDPVLALDAEVDFAISQTANKYSAAVMVVEGLLQRYAGTDPTSLTVGNLSETYGDRSARLTATLMNLRRQAQMRGIVPVAGGVLEADRVSREADTSLRVSVFALGMDDNRTSITSSTEQA